MAGADLPVLLSPGGECARVRRATEEVAVTADLCRLGAMTRGVILSLGLAVDDLEAGHYGTEDRERLASYLDNLAHALRCPGGHDLDRVVDGRRVDR